MEKAKFLIVSEITNADAADEEKLRSEVDLLVDVACKQHALLHPPEIAVAAVH
jgi:hypothetical protein